MLLPFTGFLVRPNWAHRVVPPAYDALTPAERAAIAAANPYSFLHVTRSPEDVPAGDPAGTEEVLKQARASLERLLSAGAYQPIDKPALFVYRIRSADWEQTGLVGALPASAFAGDRIRLHEEASQHRVELLARHLGEVGAISSPIALGYRSITGLDQRLRSACETTTPALEVSPDDGTTHTLWRITGDVGIRELSAPLAESTFYVTDGHHRAAAAIQAARAGMSDDLVLVVCFPDEQLRILPFHRRVRGSVSDAAARLRSLGRRFSIEQRAAAGAGDQRTIVGYAQRRWWRLRPVGSRPPGVAGLLVSVLHNDVLAPGFGITDVDDTRLELVSGLVSASVIAERCDADGGVAFLLPPPVVDDVFEVADRGESMPAKSTFFHPKPRSGLFLLLR